MKKLHYGKRGMALLLTLTLMAGLLPPDTLAFAEGQTSDGTPEGSLEEALNADTTYYEVTFALPEGLSDEEAAEITLPEPAMLPSGTLLYAVAEPARANYNFAGWYYDAALTEPADGGDAVERNLTLYPSFTPIQNYEDEFRINYMSAQDVEPDYAIEVVSYGLTEEQIRNLLKVTDLSKVDGAEEFVLERLAPDMTALIPDEDLRARASDIISQAQDGKLEGTLTDALAALTIEDIEEDLTEAEDIEEGAAEAEDIENGAAEAEDVEEGSAETDNVEEGEDETEDTETESALSEKVISELAAYYAPMERSMTMENMDLFMRVKTAGLDVNNVTIAQLLDIATDADLALLNLPEGNTIEGGKDTAIDLESWLDIDEELLPAAHYTVRPAGRAWHRGDMHQVEILDTAYLRFFRDGEAASRYVVYYNITVHQDDFNNMKLNSSLVFLPFAEVTGVSLDKGLFKADAENDSDQITVTENDESGVLVYTGDEPVSAGITVAVYDGTLNADGTIDGSVGYFKITEALGEGRFAFESPDFTDVVFLPDIIPVRDDGSFEDGEILLSADQLDFSGQVCEELDLSADTVVEPGDFVAVYTGSIDQPDGMALTGYGCITAVEKEGEGLRVHYDAVSEQMLMQASDMFMHVDNIPVPMSDEELEEVGRLVEKDVEESGFLEDSAEYVKDLITEPEEAILPDSKYSDALTEITFQREDGGEISLAEVRELAGGSRVEVEWPPKLSFLVGLSLQHFDGTGLRAEMAAEMTITIKLNDGADIKITVVAMIEVEVALGLNIKWEVEWRKAWIFPYIYDIGGTVGLHAGIYVGAGITVTVKTVSAEQDPNSVDGLMSGYAKDKDGNYKFTSDKQNSALKFINKVGTGLENIAKISKAGGDGLHLSSIPGHKGGAKNKKGEQTKPDAETDEMHGTVGGSFEEKYSNFIQESDAEYVPLVNRNLATFELPADPLHIVALSLGINFVVKLKINVMLGVSITYGNAKQITATFTIFHPHSESTCGDLETPNFQVDFFIFGMVGVRVGFEFDFRIGVISTALASLGVTAEIGIYLEFFGYFYIAYKWESGKGSHTEMFGSLLVQFGLYLDIDFKMQMGGDALEQRFDIYDVRWPLLSLGDEFCALDFEIEDDDDKLDLEIEARTDKNKNQESTDNHVIGGASIKVPDELFDIQFLEIDTGEIDSDNMDRDVAVGGSSSFTAWGMRYTQQDERNFHVEFTPKGKNFANATNADKAKGAFWYNPVNNTIYAKPNSTKDTELWGEFTFTWYQGEPAKTKSYLNFGAGFGLNTRKIERTVKVHWTGTPISGTADVYMAKAKGKEVSYQDLSSFANAKKLYTKKETIQFDGLEGVLYYMDLKGLTDRYPGYRLAYAKETFDKAAEDAYLEYFSQGESNIFLELLRLGLYEYEVIEGDANSKGWLLVWPGDTHLYFMMHAPDTRADLYFNFSETETDWHILDDKANSASPLASVYEAGTTTGYKALENLPAAIRSKMDTTAYNYDWYSYSAPNNNGTNIRGLKTRIVYSEWNSTLDVENRDENTIYLELTNMPAFSDFIGNKGKWVKVTEASRVPVQQTVYFAIRTPRTFTVTWKYDEGDQKTQVKYGEALRPPKTPALAGAVFQYWADANGKQYKTMPAGDLTLYPVFIGNERTVTWILDGQTKTSKARVGESPLAGCPFKANNQRYNWTTVKGDLLTTVTEEYKLSNSDITLYGQYIYQCDWMLYDTGNRKYTSLIRDDFKHQEKLAEGKVLQNLPEEVRRYLTDKRYTYSYYRTYRLGETAVKAQKDNWGAVYNSTLFYAYDCTYILQRSPVMVNVTWKYDDGDVVTSNWVGRKLSAPKTISRKGYNFSGWADADGKTYTYPPYNDVTLYPQFTEHEHTWDNGTTSVPATCTETGTMIYTCKDCGKTKTAVVPVNLNNHVGETQIKNAVDATCTGDGYTGDTYCTSCGRKITSGKEIAATGHSWGGWTQITAPTCMGEGEETRVCSNDSSHTETRAIAATGHNWGEWKQTTAPTCTGEGEETRVCLNDSSHTEKRATAATGHNWGAPEWTWTGVDKAAAKFICENDEDHTQNVNAAITGKRTDPACEASGSVVYTATVTFNGKTYTDTTSETLPAAGHKWGQWTVTTAPSCTQAGEETRVCANDSSHTEKRAVAAAGHTWGEPGWSWAEDYSKASATFICTKDESHVEKPEAQIDMVRTEPTAEAEGSEVYTATVTFEGKTYSDTQTKVLPKLIAPKLGSEEHTKDDEPAFELAWLHKNENTYLGQFDPAEDLWLWAFVSGSPDAEDQEDIQAALTWAEDYSSVKIADIKPGDTFKIHIAPTGRTDVGEVDAALTIIHEDHELLSERETVKEPTCSDKGEERIVCSVCGKTWTDEIDIDPDAHSWKDNGGGRLATLSGGMDGYYEVLLSAGAKKQVCELCGEQKDGEPVKLKPEAEDMEITLEELFSNGSPATVADCVLPMDSATVAVDEVKGPSGAPKSRTFTVNAEYTWAEDYSTITRSSMDAAFMKDPSYEYTFRVNVHAKGEHFDWFEEDDPDYYGRFGRIDVSAKKDDFEDGEATVVVTGHAHDWEETGRQKHTETENGCIKYVCSICSKTKEETVPAGHVWEPDYETMNEPLATPAEEGSSGALQSTDGGWYLYEYGSAKYRCTLCDEEKDGQVLPPYIEMDRIKNEELTIADALKLGFDKVSDLDPAFFYRGLTEVQTEEEEWVSLIIPGSYALEDGDLTGTQTLTKLYDDPDFEFAEIPFTFTPGVFTDYEGSTGCSVYLLNERAQRFHGVLHSEDEWTFKEAVAPYYENGAWQRGRKVYVCDICGIEKEEPGEQLMPTARSSVSGIDSLSFPANFLRRNEVELASELVNGLYRFVDIYYAAGGQNEQLLYGGKIKLGSVAFAEDAGDEMKNMQLSGITESVVLPLVFTPYDTEGAFEPLKFLVTVTPGDSLQTTAGRRSKALNRIPDDPEEEFTEAPEAEAEEKPAEVLEAEAQEKPAEALEVEAQEEPAKGPEADAWEESANATEADAKEEPTEAPKAEPAEESAQEPEEEPAEESAAVPDGELTEAPVQAAFIGSVQVELINKGDVKENDKVDFEAVVNGDKSLVSICWQQWAENGKTHEREWVTIKESDKISIEATDANAAETYRVALFDAQGQVCAEANVKFPKFSHISGKAVHENKTAATCTAEGHYDEVIYCTACGKELSREAKTIEKIAHAAGKAVHENETAATCTAEGHYDEAVYCTVCGKELSREKKTIQKTAHTSGKAVRENEVAATCTAEGRYDEVVYCSACGEQLSRETKTIEKIAHTPGEAVHENEVAATSEKGGSYDEVVSCEKCGKELSRITKSTEPDPDK